MALSTVPQTKTAETPSHFLDFFSQAIERYKNSVKDAGDSVNAESQKQRSGPAKKRSPNYNAVSDDTSAENPSKMAKLCSAEITAEAVPSSEDYPKGESGAELEKKRLASRVSSRRTREREKLRMDHFRNAKMKLQQENDKLKDENDEIRNLIDMIKKEQSMLSNKVAVVQSLAANSTSLSQGSNEAYQSSTAPTLFASQLQHQQSPLQQQQQFPQQQAMTSLLLNAIQGGNNYMSNAPVASVPQTQPSQEQQLLSLLSLMTSTPALGQLLGAIQIQQPQQQTQQQINLLATLQGYVGGLVGGLHNNKLNNNNSNNLQQNLLNLLLSSQGGGENNYLMNHTAGNTM